MKLQLVAFVLCAVSFGVVVAAYSTPFRSDLLSLTDTGPPQPLNYSAWISQTVLMISAHPDDIEASAGGLIALLTAQGTIVHYLIVTNGDKGCGNLELCGNYTSAQIAAARQLEAIRAAAVLGVPASNVHLLTYNDAMVASYPEQQIRAEVVGVIREVQPEVIMTWFPYPRFELLPSAGWADLGYHPDHQAVGKIALDSSFDAGLSRLWPEVGAPHRANEFYMWEYTADLTHYVDISSVFDVKVNSYLAHATQVGDPSSIAPMFYQLGSRLANLTAAPVKLAEAFRAYF